MWSTLPDDRARTRFCGSCELEVHDATSLTRDEVEALLRKRKDGERICFHLSVRAKDGAILLADGHAMPSKAFARKSIAAAAAAASAAALAGCGATTGNAVPTTVVDVAPPAALAPAPSVATPENVTATPDTPTATAPDMFPPSAVPPKAAPASRTASTRGAPVIVKPKPAPRTTAHPGQRMKGHVYIDVDGGI